MEKLFKNNRFYPQNFFVRQAENTDIESVLRQVSQKAAQISPESFDAETLYFIFRLRYQPPYVKISEFREIKDLQIEAISNTRFKNEYNGYIGIDISEWVEHADEEHFINCIRSLRKMSPHWKYIFFADEHCGKACIDSTLNVIKTELWLRELTNDAFPAAGFDDMLSEKMKQRHGVNLTDDSKRVIRAVFHENDRISNETASAMADDMTTYCADMKSISEDTLVTYLTDDTYAKSIMTEKEIAKLTEYIRTGEVKR